MNPYALKLINQTAGWYALAGLEFQPDRDMAGGLAM